MSWHLVGNKEQWQSLYKSLKPKLQKLLQNVEIVEYPILISFDTPNQNWNILNLRALQKDEQLSAKVLGMIEELCNSHSIQNIDKLAECLIDELDLD